jgi:hypothetical protein
MLSAGRRSIFARCPRIAATPTYVAIYNQWRSTTLQLETTLQRVDQLWVISSNSNSIPATHIAAISNYFNRGGNLYLWGDNDPSNAGVNPVIAAVMPGVQLTGNYHATKYVGVRPP